MPDFGLNIPTNNRGIDIATYLSLHKRNTSSLWGVVLNKYLHLVILLSLLVSYHS